MEPPLCIDNFVFFPSIHTSVGYVESKLLQSDLASVISKVEEASRRPSVSGEGGGLDKPGRGVSEWVYLALCIGGVNRRGRRRPNRHAVGHWALFLAAFGRKVMLRAKVDTFNPTHHLCPIHCFVHIEQCVNSCLSAFFLVC